MTRIVECAESTLLLVVPESSHVWRRFAPAPNVKPVERPGDENAGDAGATTSLNPATSDS
jgi:hypothetical protein